MGSGWGSSGADPVGPGPSVPLAPLQAKDPHQIGGFRLVGRLGAGGMGVAYLAESDEGTWVVVKALRAELADDRSFRARLAREVEAMRRVEPGHTAAVLAADLEGDAPFLAMEYVPGITLAQRVQDGGPLPMDAVHRLAFELAGVLAAVHQVGVVHRDVKPANVMLSPRGVRLIDFGVADLADATALTKTGLVVGSTGWLAPEQITGDEVGPAADVHAWGCVVTYAATGVAPFAGTQTAATIYRVLHEEPVVPTTIPDPLRALVVAALAKDPHARPRLVDVQAQLAETVSPGGPGPAGAAAMTAATAVPGAPGGPGYPPGYPPGATPPPGYGYSYPPPPGATPPPGYTPPPGATPPPGYPAPPGATPPPGYTPPPGATPPPGYPQAPAYAAPPGATQPPSWGGYGGWSATPAGPGYPTPPPGATPPPGYPPPPGTAAPTGAASGGPTAPRRRRGRLIAIGVAGVLVLAGIGVGAVLLLRNRDGNGGGGAGGSGLAAAQDAFPALRDAQGGTWSDVVASPGPFDAVAVQVKGDQVVTWGARDDAWNRVATRAVSDVSPGATASGATFTYADFSGDGSDDVLTGLGLSAASGGVTEWGLVALNSGVVADFWDRSGGQPTTAQWLLPGLHLADPAASEPVLVGGNGVRYSFDPATQSFQSQGAATASPSPSPSPSPTPTPVDPWTAALDSLPALQADVGKGLYWSDPVRPAEGPYDAVVVHITKKGYQVYVASDGNWRPTTGLDTKSWASATSEQRDLTGDGTTDILLQVQDTQGDPYGFVVLNDGSVPSFIWVDGETYGFIYNLQWRNGRLIDAYTNGDVYSQWTYKPDKDVFRASCVAPGCGA